MKNNNVKCLNCGNEFYIKPSRIGKAKNITCSKSCADEYKHKLAIKPIEGRYNKPIKEILIDLYEVQTMSVRQVTSLLGVQHRTVLNWFKRYGVNVRHGSEAIKVQWEKPSADARRELSSEIAKKYLCKREVRDKARLAMQTKEYRHKQSISKIGPRNGMYGKCGELHNNWNPNLTDEERENGRNTFENYQWRKDVYERDSYTCQNCGDSKGGNLVAHHINSHDIHKDQRYDIENGVTLCEKCHKDFHSKYGYGKNTRTQFSEWLKTD